MTPHDNLLLQYTINWCCQRQMKSEFHQIRLSCIYVRLKLFTPDSLKFWSTYCRFHWYIHANGQWFSLCSFVTVLVAGNCLVRDTYHMFSTDFSFHISCGQFAATIHITSNINHALSASTHKQCCLGTSGAVSFEYFYVFHCIGSARTFAASVKKHIRLHGWMSWWSQGQSWRLRWTSTYMAAVYLVCLITADVGTQRKFPTRFF